MRFLKWFLQFFKAPRAALPRQQPRVKFLEGTEWLCPHCGTTIAIANRDIHYGDLAMSSHWDVKDKGFWDVKHCDAHLFQYGASGRQIFTPTGWVG